MCLEWRPCWCLSSLDIMSTNAREVDLLMIGRKLAVPVAAMFALTGVMGAGYSAGHAHAARSPDTYSGTIAWTDNAFPDGTIYGGAFGNTVTDYSPMQPLIANTLLVNNKTQ